MSNKSYPRIGEQRFKAHRWDEQRRKHPNNKQLIRPCVVCGAPSTHEVFLQVDWFRGNDEGPFRACKPHKDALDFSGSGNASHHTFTRYGAAGESMSDAAKTHYRKAFDSPYLSSADIVEPTVLTIKRVGLEPDRTKKTKDEFNTAHFVETEIRRGEKLKPMILNATNSKTMRTLTGSAFIEDWNGVRVTVYVEHGVKFGRDTVDGLRISPHAPEEKRRTLTPESAKTWAAAIAAIKRDGNLNSVLEHVDMSEEHQAQAMAEAKAQSEEGAAA